MNTIILVTYLLAPWGTVPFGEIVVGTCNPRNGGCMETEEICQAFKHERKFTFRAPDPYLGAAFVCRVERPND
jgi:hypothetical protein